MVKIEQIDSFIRYVAAFFSMTDRDLQQLDHEDRKNLDLIEENIAKARNASD